MSFIEPAPTTLADEVFADHAPTCRCWDCTVFGVTNAAGRSFAVRIVRKGDAYGNNGCLTWEFDEIAVEFYDATYDDGRFDPWGQFTGARYHLSSLVTRQPNRGLALHGGVPEWALDIDALRRVMERLALETAVAA